MLRFDLALFLFFPVVIDLDLTPERKQVHHFLLPDEFLDGGGYRFGLGFFTGGLLGLSDKVVGYVQCCTHIMHLQNMRLLYA